MKILGRKLTNSNTLGRKIQGGSILGRKLVHSHNIAPPNEEFIQHHKSDIEKGDGDGRAHLTEYRPHRDHIKGIGIHSTIPENPANLFIHHGCNRKPHERAHKH